MKVRVKVDIESMSIDEVIEGSNESEVVKKMRDELTKRANFAQRLVLRALPDQTLWAKIVDMHNTKRGDSERAPTTPAQFLAFGERAGYVTKLG